MADNNVKLTPEIDQLTQKLITDPKSRVFAQLADAYRKSGMLDEAIETAKRGLDIHPNYAIAHNILGRCYLEKKMFALAVEEFQLTIRSDPQNLVGYKMLATAFEKQGMLDEALKYYQMVLDLEPGEIEVAEKIEKLRADSGAGFTPAPARTPEPEPVAPLPEPVPEPEPSALVLEDVQLRTAAGTDGITAPAPSEAVALETVLPDALKEPESEPAPELVIEKTPEPFIPVSMAPEPPPAVPVAEPALVEPVAPSGEGEATPTLAEIYAQQGHYEKAIEIYQKLVSESPDNGSYKVKLDELLAKAYPDEMAQTGPDPAPSAPPAPAMPAALAAPAAPDVPDRMFSQMFSEMEKAAGSAELNLPDHEETKTEPLALAPEPPKEEVRLEPELAAAPAAVLPPAAAPDPVSFGALFASEQPAPAAAGSAAPDAPKQTGGAAEEPKKDDAVSSFQSWLNGLQK